MFTSHQNRDNLAECLSNQDVLLQNFQESAASIMKRWNADVEDGVTHLRTTYQSLTGASTNCSADTQEQIKTVVERLNEINEETILNNLAESKHHVELTFANMKMNASVHDFSTYGMNLADLYITLAAQ